MRRGHRRPLPTRSSERLRQRRWLQPTSHRRSLPPEKIMSRRIILITGANGGLGQAIGRSFLKTAEEDFVWLAVHKATDQAGLLAKEFAPRCQLLPLDVTRVDSW